MLEAFLVGFIFATSIVASTFFVKFWRSTGDKLFLAFAVAFAIEGVSRIFSIVLVNPSDGAPFIYMTRLAAYLTIIAAIVAKNRRSNSR